MKNHGAIKVILSFFSVWFLVVCEEHSARADESKAPAPPASTPNVSPAEKAAIDKFQAELRVVRTAVDPVMQEAQEAQKVEPLAGLIPLKFITNAMQGVKGDGLPPDLKKAWVKMTSSYKEMSILFKDFPDKPSDLTNWIKKNVGTNAAAIQKWQTELNTKMQLISKDGDAALQDLNTLSVKYGLDPNLFN